MLIYHQCGHNAVWNVDSLLEDHVGEGLIISPVNIESDKIRERYPEDLLASSWMDPQFYVPHDNKGKLETYPFFPGNVLEEFSTRDYESHAFEIASQCLQFQHDLGLRYLVIPTRYFDHLPDDYLEQFDALFVEPFVAAKRDLGLEERLLLTIVPKPHHLGPGTPRDELLSWATGNHNIEGVYLLFDNDFDSKQIKDADYLVGQLRFVHALRQNRIEVHVGYSGLEGLLLSLADPTSVSVGAYENLRSFGTDRLISKDPAVLRGPTPRVYSGRLFQWMEETYLPPIRQLVANWEDLFDDSPYKDYLLNPPKKLHFSNPRIYKHYFFVFAQQVGLLPQLEARSDQLRTLVTNALTEFARIGDAGVLLDANSDGSHLIAWMNAMAMFSDQPE